tara:strand:- start:201 stop:344 length:144 start_codon:yes stop_codon:yes gene_type:complete
LQAGGRALKLPSHFDNDLIDRIIPRKMMAMKGKVGHYKSRPQGQGTA